MSNLKKRSHLFIADCQTKPGVPLNNLVWIGKYMAEHTPDVVINIGDFEDCHALSYWDKGKIQFEGRRVSEDDACTDLALELLYGTAANANPEWWETTRTVMTQGNHEYRRIRAIESSPELHGLLHTTHPGYYEWHDDVVAFGDAIIVDGIAYSHFFQDPNTGRPMGGMIHTKLRKVGMSFSAGHTPGFEYAEVQNFAGITRIGMVAGAGYLHYEDYKKGQGNKGHWRGIVVKNEVENGSYDLMKVSLDYLCRKYEGVTLKEFANNPKLWIGYGAMDNTAMQWV